MIRQLNQYGAVSTKVKAMYGKRLSDEDYKRLASMHTLDEIVTFLRQQPAWSLATADLSAGRITRHRIEVSLRRQYLYEYEKIFHFISQRDRNLMRFPILKAELHAILNAVRRLHSEHPMEEDMLPTPFYQKHSKIDLTSLLTCQTYDQALQAVTGSIFSAPMQRLRATVGDREINYTALEAVLESTLYTYLYHDLAERYTGKDRKLLQHSLSLRVDLLNIIHLLRLKKYFPGDDLNTYAFSFSFSDVLTKDFIQSLMNAPDYAAAMELLHVSPYRKIFAEPVSGGIEAYLYNVLYRFNKEQIQTTVPSIYVPIAYLELKEIEMLNLISLIECVRYGMDFKDYPMDLIGVTF